MLPDTVYTLLGCKTILKTHGKQGLMQFCCIPMTNASHDPPREFEQVLCIAAACGSSGDAQAQMPAATKQLLFQQRNTNSKTACGLVCHKHNRCTAVQGGHSASTTA